MKLPPPNSEEIARPVRLDKGRAKPVAEPVSGMVVFAAGGSYKQQQDVRQIPLPGTDSIGEKGKDRTCFCRH
jgi:hypothetical protein